MFSITDLLGVVPERRNSSKEALEDWDNNNPKISIMLENVVKNREKNTQKVPVKKETATKVLKIKPKSKQQLPPPVEKEPEEEVKTEKKKFKIKRQRSK